jgi:general secretion pathway protein L
VSIANALIIALAARAEDAPHWWRLRDGAIVARGEGWQPIWAEADAPDAETRIVGVAPTSACILHQGSFPDLSDRQAEVAARLLAAEASIAPAETLHVAIGPRDSDGRGAVAAVTMTAMREWIAEAAVHQVTLQSLVPAAAVAPVDVGPGNPANAWVISAIGSERVVRGRDSSFVDDPLLTAHIIGDSPSREAGAAEVETALVAAVASPPVELLSGPFARRPAPLIDRALLRRAANIVVAIVVISIAIAVARLVRTHADIARLDSEAESAAASVLRPAPPPGQAVAALDAELARRGAGTGRPGVVIASLIAAMESQPNVAIDSLSWGSDGTLTVTLGAPRAEDINPVLIAIQYAGYSITAQPRSAPDGRALADMTVRSAP